MALAKYMAHSAASIVAHWGELWVAICLRKWVSYSFHGEPWKSWLALTIVELYARRSRTCSWLRMATTLMSVLKDSTHSSMVEMFFLGLAFSPCNRASSTVGPGAPKRAGNSSSRSINSPRQIFSVNFDGIGGEIGPTVIAFFD